MLDTTTSATTAPSLDRIYAAMLGDLQTYAATVGAVASLAKDPENALLQLVDQIGGPRIVLQPESGESVREDIQPGVEKNRFRVFISSAIGVSAGRSDDSVVEGIGGEPSIVRQLDDLRRRILSWRFDSTAIDRGVVWCAGYDPVFTPDGYPLAAYSLNCLFRSLVRTAPAAENIAIAIGEA